MSKHREPFANSNAYYEERNKEPEQILWISVLTLAMNDAFKSNDWNTAIDAINWIKHDSGDFKKVWAQFCNEDMILVLPEAKKLADKIERKKNEQTI